MDIRERPSVVVADNEARIAPGAGHPVTRALKETKAKQLSSKVGGKLRFSGGLFAGFLSIRTDREAKVSQSARVLAERP